jgi:putative DNA primase/helicase
MNPDKNLLDKMREEYGGILQWMIEGAVSYYREGLQIPDFIAAATQDYASEEDDVGQWLDECCVKQETAFAAIGELYQSYATWADENGGRPFKKRGLGERLRQLGFSPDKQQQRRGYLGLRVKTGGEHRREANGRQAQPQEDTATASGGDHQHTASEESRPHGVTLQ